LELAAINIACVESLIEIRLNNYERRWGEELIEQRWSSAHARVLVMRGSLSKRLLGRKVAEPSLGHFVKSLTQRGEDRDLTCVLFPASDRDIDILWVKLNCRARRPVFSAAMKIVPLPQKGSRTRLPRFEQSLTASATIATGLTVGCTANSSIRPARMVFTPS